MHLTLIDAHEYLHAKQKSHQTRITPYHVQKDGDLANLTSFKEEIKSNMGALI